MPTQREPAVTYWCLPCREDAARYQAVIEALTAEQRAPLFAPHLTLATFHEAPADVSAVADALKGLVLQPMEIAGTDAFTKALFVRFERTEALIAARRMMKALPGFRSGRPFDPHLSLCYGIPPAGAIERADVHALLDQPVRFDRLVSVPIEIPVASQADIAEWHTEDASVF